MGSEHQTDYLVVGAGATGMVFVDVLLEHTSADIVLVDERHAPGGHWLDGYPFVRLHQPSAWYGVPSTPLGSDRLAEDGPEAGMYERASGVEVCAYFDRVMRDRFLASGRVRYHPMSRWLGGGRFRSLVTGEQHQVEIRRSLVNATYLPSQVPATTPPPFEVAADVRCVPVGDLTRLDEPAERYVVVGGGKTGIDAVLWLREQGVDPERISWVRPRDCWLLERRFVQPLGLSLGTFDAFTRQLEIAAEATSVDDCFLDFERAGVMHRIDPNVRPTMMKGATVSSAELELLREVEDVIRLGHVRRLERDRMVLAEGTVPATSGTVYVHCAASGLAYRDTRPVFTDDELTVQPIRLGSTPLSAGLIAYIESTDRSVEEKNQLCPPLGITDTPADWLEITRASTLSKQEERRHPDVQAFVDGYRLEVTNGLGRSAAPEALAPIIERYASALGPALDNLGRIRADLP